MRLTGGGLGTRLTGGGLGMRLTGGGLGMRLTGGGLGTRLTGGGLGMRLEYPYIQVSIQNAILPELKHSTLAVMFVGSNALSLFC